MSFVILTGPQEMSCSVMMLQVINKHIFSFFLSLIFLSINISVLLVLTALSYGKSMCNLNYHSFVTSLAHSIHSTGKQ